MSRAFTGTGTISSQNSSSARAPGHLTPQPMGSGTGESPSNGCASHAINKAMGSLNLPRDLPLATPCQVTRGKVSPYI